MSNFISAVFSLRLVWAWITVGLIYAVSVLLSQSQLLNNHPDVLIGITYDLTIMAPIVYLVIIWRTQIPKITALPVFVIGFLLASAILPENTHLNFIKVVVLPLVELGVIGLIIIKVRQTLQEIRVNRQAESDLYTALKKSSITILKNDRLGKIFATEIAMIYFALFTWRKALPHSNQYTGYKQNGVIAVFLALVFLVIVETFVVHLLLIRWHELTAWLIFALSIYAGVQLLGHTKALMRRFTELGSDKLILRYGLFGDAEIAYEKIESVSAFSEDLEGKEVKPLKLLGTLEGHNILLELNSSITVESVYGTKKQCSKILLQIDESKQFIEVLNNKINVQSLQR